MNNKVKELQEQNNQLDKSIHAENQEIFTDMICYIRGANISDYNQELVRADLTEMVLSAQERGESIYNVIGGNFKDFCDNVIANLPPRTMKEKLVDFLDVFCLGLSILGTINIVFSQDARSILQGLFAEETVNYNIAITLGTLISTAIILIVSVVIVEMIMKNAFKKQREGNRILKGCVAGAGIMAIFLLVAQFGKTVVFTVPIFLAIAFLATLFIAHKLLSRI